MVCACMNFTWSAVEPTSVCATSTSVCATSTFYAPCPKRYRTTADIEYSEQRWYSLDQQHSADWCSEIGWVVPRRGGCTNPHLVINGVPTSKRRFSVSIPYVTRYCATATCSRHGSKLYKGRCTQCAALVGGCRDSLVTRMSSATQSTLSAPCATRHCTSAARCATDLMQKSGHPR